MSISREEYENTFIRFTYALGFNSTPLFYPYKANTFKYLKVNDILGFNWQCPDWSECQNAENEERVTGAPVWRLGFYSRKSEKLKFECIRRLKENPIQFLNWYMPGYNIDYYDYSTWRESGLFNEEKMLKNDLIKIRHIKNRNVLQTGDICDEMSVWDMYRVYHFRIKGYYKIIKAHNDYLFKKEQKANLKRFVRATVNMHAPVVRLICRNDFDQKFPKKLLTLINRTLHTNYDESLFLYKEHTLEGDSVVFLYTDKVYDYESRIRLSELVSKRLQMEIDTIFMQRYYNILPLSILTMAERTKEHHMEVMESVIAKAMRISRDEKQALYDGNIFELDKFIIQLPNNGMLKIPEVINARKGVFVETKKNIQSVVEFCQSRGWVVRVGARSANQVKIVSAGILRGFSESQCQELLNLLWEGSEDYPSGLPERMFSQLYSYCLTKTMRQVVQHTTTYDDIYFNGNSFGDSFLKDFRDTNKYKSHFIPDIIRLFNEKSLSLDKHHVMKCMFKKDPAQIRKLFKEVNNQLIENVFYNIYNPRRNDFRAKDYKDLNRKIYFSFTIFKKVCLHIDFMKDYKDPTLKQFYYVVKDVLMKYYSLLPNKLTDKHTYIASKICETYTSEFMNNDVFTVKCIEECNKIGSKDAKKLMKRFKEWLCYNRIIPNSKEQIDILFDSFIAECKKEGSICATQDVLEVLKAHKMGGIRNKKLYYETAKRRLQLNRIINNT